MSSNQRYKHYQAEDEMLDNGSKSPHKLQMERFQRALSQDEARRIKKQLRKQQKRHHASRSSDSEMQFQKMRDNANHCMASRSPGGAKRRQHIYVNEKHTSDRGQKRADNSRRSREMPRTILVPETKKSRTISPADYSESSTSLRQPPAFIHNASGSLGPPQGRGRGHPMMHQPSMGPGNQNDSLVLGHVNNTGYFPGAHYQSRGGQNRSSGGVNSPANRMPGQGPLIQHFQDNSRLLSSIDHIEADQSNIVQPEFHLTTQGGWMGTTQKQGLNQNPQYQGGFNSNCPQQFRRSSNNSMSAEKMIRERASEYSGNNAREALNDTEEIENDYKNLTREFKAKSHIKGRSSSYSLEQYHNQNANRVLNVHDTTQSAVKQTLDKASKINLSPMAYDSIKKQQRISDYPSQIMHGQQDGNFRSINPHNREVSFNVIRGTQVKTSTHSTDLNQPLEAHRQFSHPTDEKTPYNQPRYSRRSLLSYSQGKQYADQASSHKSPEIMGVKMHKTMSDEHKHEFNQQQRRQFSKTIESPLQPVQDSANRVRSISPTRYQYQPHENTSDKQTRSEKVIASSPRFSQAERRREEERTTQEQRVAQHISQPQIRYPQQRDRRLDDLEDEPPIPMDLPEQCQEMSMLQNMSSSVGGLNNMNFNTQDLIQMTSPKSNSDYTPQDDQTSEARDHKAVIKNRPSGRTTTNTRGPLASSNPNFRSSGSNTQTGNALIPNGLGSELYSSALMHTQDARCQNDDTFRGENFIQQQSLEAGIGSMGSQIKGSANAFQATRHTIVDSNNLLTGTRGLHQTMNTQINQSEDLLEKVMDGRVADKFDGMVEKYWIKQKLGSIHQSVNSLQVNVQNIAAGLNGQTRQNRVDSYFNLIDYKRMSHIEILNDLDKLTKRLLAETSTLSQQQQAQGMSRGLSPLSDIDTHFQMSRLSPRNNRTLALQANASTSSLQTKYDLDLDNLRKQKEESDAMVNNLRKTVKDMAKQMKELEKAPLPRSMTENASFEETHSNVHFLESKLEKKAMNERDLKDELVSQQSRLLEVTSTHENKTRQLKDQFKNKFEEQNSFIDDLKSELNSAITRTREQHTDLVNHGTQLKILNESLRAKEEENTRLSRQIETMNRTLQISKQQQAGDLRTHEGDKLRLNAAKEQEKHWKCGYETIFKKYTKLKEQLPQKDHDLRKMERDYQQKIKNISRKAEDAIRHFKNLAISRVGPGNVTEPRMSHAAREARFQQQAQSSIQYTESQHTLASNNQYRSRSVNTALANIEHADFRYSNTPSSLTRAGQATPARDHGHNIHYSARRHADNHSVRSFSPRGPSITFNRGNGGELDKYRTLSTRGQKRLKFLDRIQNVNQDERGAHTDDKQLLIALEALEDAFNEIASFKAECHELSKVYFSKTCQQLQNFQVQSYDYIEQIDSYIARDKEQVRLLQDRQKQIGDLKLVVENSQQMVKSLVGHIKEIKGLKEMQWRNIISYDLVKDQEKRRLKESVHCEVQRTKNIIAKLHEEIRDRETIIESKAMEVQQVEQDKYGIDNRLREVRDAKEVVVKKLNDVSLQKSQLEDKLSQIQQSIKEIHVSSGADQTASATFQSEPMGSDLPSMTQTFQFGSKEKHLMPTLMEDRNSMTINEYPYPDAIHTNQLSRTQVEPQKFPPDQKIGSYEVTLKQNYRPKSEGIGGGPMMPLEWLSQIKLHLGQLKDQIHQDSVYQQAVGDLVANHLNQKDDSLLQNDQESSVEIGNPFQVDNRENQSHFANRMGTQLNNLNFSYQKARTNSPSYEPSYVASGPQTQVHSPTNNHISNNKGNLMRTDTASHSLDSFMNQENQGGNYQEERAGGMQRLSDIFHHKNYPIHDQIRELLRESRLKSLTILSMRKDFQQYQDEHDQAQDELKEKIQGLEHQIQSTQAEKDQIGQVYEQENKMRQDLEEEVEEKNQAITEANDQIKEFESDLKTFQEQMNQMVVEKQKVDQSCDYWEGSFKLVEQHFLEQKERSHNEIDNLTQQVQMLDDTLEQRNQELQDTREELQILKQEYEPIQEARNKMQDANCQTNETKDTIQRFFDDNEVLYMENEQIKRDIQVLIDSYENYKKENQQIQESQRDQLQQMQKDCKADKQSFKEEQKGVLDHLNREIQDQIQVRQQKEALLSHTMQTLEEYENKKNSSNGQFQQVIQNLEKDKEELEVNLISQQNQIDQLNNFNQVIQSFNTQLQFQMTQIKEQMFINIQNQQYQPQLMAQSSTSQISPLTNQQNKLQYQASGLSPSLATSANNTNRNLEARFRALPSCSSNTLQKSQSINHFAQRVNDQNDHGSTSRNQNIANYEQPHFHSMSSVRQFVRNRSSSKGQEKQHAKRDSQFSFVAKNNSQDKKISNEHDETIQNLQQQLNDNEEFILALSQGGQQFGNQGQQNQNIDIQVQGHVIEDINQNNISINMNQQNQSPSYPDEKNETLGINSGIQSSNAFISNMQSNITSNAQVTPTAQNAPYIQLQQNQYGPLQMERQLNTMSGSQVHLNQLSEHCYQDLSTQQNGVMSQHAIYQNPLGTMGANSQSSRGQINSMHPTSNRLDPRSIHMEETSMGLDMCQQCIEYQGQAQAQKDLVRKLVQNYVQHARKLTSMCMEGSILLRLNGSDSQKIISQETTVNNSTMSITGKGRNCESSLSSEVGAGQNRHNNQGNISLVSQLSDPEKKTNMIRQAQKFLQKDIEKFIGPREIQGVISQNESNLNNKMNASIARKQDRLVRYANEMADIAQLLVQNSCEITINNFQGQSAQRKQDLGKSSSLKIHDYQPQVIEQDVLTKKQRKRTTVNTGCQTIQSEPTLGQTAPSARNPKSPTDETDPMSDQNGYNNNIAPCPQLAVPNHILLDIEDLGTSLDNKISIFVQLLLGLKTTQKQTNKEDQVVHKMLKQLTSAISRMVHELTEDTETLAEIKQRLSDFQPTPYLGRSSEKQDFGDHQSEQSKNSKAHDMPLSVTMDCIRSMSKTQNLKQERKKLINNQSTVMGINFVNEDGKTQSQDLYDQPTAMGNSGTSQPHSKRSHQKHSKRTSAANLGNTNQQISSATYINDLQGQQILQNPYQNNMVDPFYHQTMENKNNTFGTMGNNMSYHITSYNDNNNFNNSQLIMNQSEEDLHGEDTESIEAKAKCQNNPNWNHNETRDVVHMVNDISNMFKQPSVQKQPHQQHRQKNQRQGQIIIDNNFNEFGQQMLSKESISPRTYLNQNPSQSKVNSHRSGNSIHNPINTPLALIPESSQNTALGYNLSISKPDLERTTRTQVSQPERSSHHQEMNMTGRQIERKISREDMRALDQKLQKNRDILQVIQEKQLLQHQINNLSSAKGSMHRVSSQTLSINNHNNRNRDNQNVQQAYGEPHQQQEMMQEPDMYKQQYYQAFKHELPMSPANDNNTPKVFNQTYHVHQNQHSQLQNDRTSPLDFQVREQVINKYGNTGPQSSQTYRQNQQQRIMYDQEKHIYQTIETDGVITYKGSSMTNNTKRLRNDQ